MKRIVTLLLICFAGRTAHAIAPGYQTDYQLAQYAYIVVAKWEKAELRPHKRVRGNVLEEFEVFTELNVLRVIRGDIKPGRHALLFGFGIGWQEDGTGLRTLTSTDIPGDVDDVTKTNIWFLTRSRSWDESDKTEYFRVPHYRAIQPASLEPYFTALSSPDHEQRVPSLLSSDDPEVISRVLCYICGGILPWPYGPEEWDMYSHPQERERLLSGQANALRKRLLGDMPAHRDLAAAVYAELTGKSCIDFITTLLSDPDQKVRAVAAGVLLRNRYEESLAELAPAVRGLDDTHLACAVISEADSVGDHRLAPMLISFLQDDSYWGRIGSDVRIPAIKARVALHTVTGCWFPFSVARSQHIWAEVAPLGSWEEMQRRLRALLADEQCPLRAEFYGPLDDSHIRVFNASKQAVTICRYPAWVDANTDNMVAGAGTDYPQQTKMHDFVTLEAGGSTVFRTYFAEHFNGVDPKALSLSLFYQDLPKDEGKTGWIGWVSVQWMEPKPEESGEAQQDKSSVRARARR